MTKAEIEFIIYALEVWINVFLENNGNPIYHYFEDPYYAAEQIEAIWRGLA